MKINPVIFRAYDIRGIYPSEINEETAYLIGQAFVKFLKKRKPNIVVGRDNRLSSSALQKSLIEALLGQGANVINIGISTTPMFYWAVAHYGFDAGIQVSASHNPPEYNGFKVVGEKAIPVSEKTGLKQIQELTREGPVKLAKKGRMIKKRVLEDYIKFNLKGFNLKKLKPFKIVIDTANAVPGIVAPEFFRKLNCVIYHLFAELDGSFPNHLPSPHEEKNLRYLKDEVLNKKADLGIAFDGDGDRVVFVDEKGQMIPGDFITALLVKLILRDSPGEKILCDVRSSNIIRDVARQSGGKVLLVRIGHSFIKEKMRKENIAFEGELNGHYYKREHYFSEAPFWAILKVLQEMSVSGKTISELIEPFKKYFHSGEMNFKVKDKKRVLKKLEDKLNKGGKMLKIDGLRIDFKDWWFNARPSNTEPVLRLVVEAKTKDLMEQKKKQLISLIKN